MIADEDLTTRQAAKYLGVALRTLRLWADAGRVPHHRTPGGHRRFRRSDLVALRAERSVGRSRPEAADRVGAWAQALDDALASAEAALGPEDGQPFVRARRELQAALEEATASRGG